MIQIHTVGQVAQVGLSGSEEALLGRSHSFGFAAAIDLGWELDSSFSSSVTAAATATSPAPAPHCRVVRTPVLRVGVRVRVGAMRIARRGSRIRPVGSKWMDQDRDHGRFESAQREGMVTTVSAGGRGRSCTPSRADGVIILTRIRNCRIGRQGSWIAGCALRACPAACSRHYSTLRILPKDPTIHFFKNPAGSL